MKKLVKILAVTLVLAVTVAGSVFASAPKRTVTTAKNQVRLITNKRTENTPVGKIYWVEITTKEGGKNVVREHALEGTNKQKEEMYDLVVTTVNNHGKTVVTPMRYNMDLKIVTIPQASGVNRTITITNIQESKVK